MSEPSGRDGRGDSPSAGAGPGDISAAQAQESTRESRGSSLKRLFLGAPKNPLDPRIFHHVSLITLFAWVGLGADGLSSSCYGPEEAFLALGSHHHLALYLAVATAITVAIISITHMQIVRVFPSGGGGYVVSTKLLGGTAGVVAGSALVIDYVLTIAISSASCVDAFNSFLPAGVLAIKVPVACAIVAILTWLNLRGVKESVSILFPIFMLFVITHVTLLGAGIAGRLGALGDVFGHTVAETQNAASEGTLFALIFLVMRAYCIGGGTYTGIEAVANGVSILREPRDRTARNTMIAMGISLAVTASGLLICYLLYGVQHEPGRTLNASLTELVSGGWTLFGQPIGKAFLIATLVSEGALLFVASQTGFIDGPRVLAAMAVDGWVPRRFAYLSDRLVTQNGVAFMGALSVLMMLITGGNVKVLVILYSVNVFLVFTLAHLGMVRHWWTTRATSEKWRSQLAVAGVGFCLTLVVFLFNLIFKFTHGAWVTVILTGGFVLVCSRVKRHYARINRHLTDLDATLANLPPSLLHPPKATIQQKGPAIMLVGRYGGLGVHCLLNVLRYYRDMHDRYVFISVGEIDSSQFKGRDEVAALARSTEAHLDKYLRLARNLGLEAESRYELGTDPIPALEKICLEVGRRNPRSIVYAGQLVFQEEGTLSRLLHNQAAYSLQRRLVFQGQQMMILPIRVWEPKKKVEPGARKASLGIGARADKPGTKPQ